MSTNQLAGAWRLASFESRTDGGAVGHPWGKDPKGYYLFTADGYLCVSLMKTDPTVDMSKEILAPTIGTYIAYAGRYEIKGNKVLIHVEVSVHPNRIGTVMERMFEFSSDGNALFLSTDHTIQGKSVVTRLKWERTNK